MDQRRRSDGDEPGRPNLAQRVREAVRSHPLVAGGIAGAVLVVVVGVPTYLSLGDDRPEELGGICVDDEQIAALEQRAVRYEGEELPYAQYGSEDAIGVTDELARAGSGAGIIQSEPDDPPFNGDTGFRAEWQSDFYSTEGNEYSYGVSYWFPEDWYQGENPLTFDDRLIFQFHQGSGSPIFSLHIQDGSERLVLRHREPDGNFDYLWSTSLETERWYDFAFQAKWSKDDDGYFRLYVNGELQEDYRGPTLNDSERVYTKWGIYGQPTKLVVDEVVIIEGAYGLPLASPSVIHEVLDSSGDDARDQAQRRCQV